MLDEKKILLCRGLKTYKELDRRNPSKQIEMKRKYFWMCRFQRSLQ